MVRENQQLNMISNTWLLADKLSVQLKCFMQNMASWGIRYSLAQWTWACDITVNDKALLLAVKPIEHVFQKNYIAYGI